MRNPRLYSYIAAAALAAAPAAAQQLSQELEVQHTPAVTPDDATRPQVWPQPLIPAWKAAPLAFSERTVDLQVPPSIDFLEPTAWADTLAVSPYSGYAVLGYLPAWNLAASAGYRLIDNDTSRLSAWLQYDGNTWHDNRAVNAVTSLPYHKCLHRNTFSIGTTYHRMVGRKSEIDAGLTYTFARFTAPGQRTLFTSPLAVGNGTYTQAVNRLSLSARWLSAVQGLRYTAGIDYAFFGYVKGMQPLDWPWAARSFTRPVRENTFKFDGLAWLPLSDASTVALGLDLDVVNDSRHSWLTPLTDGSFSYTLTSAAGAGAFNRATLSLTPRYRLATSSLTLDLGARLQLSFADGRVFHVSPDVSVAWDPSPQFGIWGKATGGVVQNTIASLYDINWMTAPFLAWHNSNLPLVVEGGIKAGPFRGAYAELFGGYAIANDWLMPIGDPDAGFGPSAFRAVDMRGWHAGIAAGWKYRSLVDARLSAEAAPRSYDRGWYMWRDRARYVVRASVNSRPWAPWPLEVGLDYELRACRAIVDRAVSTAPGNIYAITRSSRLGNVSSLSLHAKWTFTPQLSAFIDLQNILNHRYTLLGLTESPGIHGLVGASYLF